ncbi:HAMP domain-containing sensor histidine kinase [Nitrososphaera sp.]|uniref:HAMP domain-containing sensor histidine kinase n=1 Tax=Nitrososphaera sp. TaxID=1971748 RepID=UPI00182236A0|nr:HAMP domain-containing sensor histidine kinase [Nitrososphaera sp.]NWG38128.1 HAMP domain-containing protein [Nitrososphaera sp.]
MEIRQQLFLSIIATGVLLAISGFILSQQISEVGRSFDEVQNKATPSIIALGNIKADFNALHAAVLAFNLHVPEASTDPEIKQLALDHRDEVQMQKEELGTSFDNYKAIVGADAASEIGDKIDMLTMHIDEMLMVGNSVMNGETMVDHAAVGGHTAAGENMEDVPPVVMLHGMILELNEQAMVFNEELDAAIAQNYESLGNTQNTVLANIGTGANLNILLTAAILGVTGIVGGGVAFSISRRVRQLEKTAGEIAEGNLGKQITTQGTDEIAALAASFEQMRRSLVEVQEELKSRNIELNELNIMLEQTNAELKQLDRLKDEFISVASHELRSPIHPILGYASMARDGMIGEKEALDVIYKQAVRLRQLANDILDVSRIESGTLPYSMKELSIHEVLANCVEAIKPSVGAEVSVVTDFDSHDIEMIGDKERLTQVFTNLLGNALKFTKKGRIAVETRLAGPDSIVVKISDTGGGIPKEILPRLFNKFVTKKVGEDEAHGTGLGLFISRSIVEAHGGKISAYNNDTGGATFRIELPLRAGGQGKKQTPIAVSAEHPREAK